MLGAPTNHRNISDHGSLDRFVLFIHETQTFLLAHDWLARSFAELFTYTSFLILIPPILLPIIIPPNPTLVHPVY